MARRDYEDDPNAPKPNSLVPAASVVVVDDVGRVLLHRRTDNGLWALPGGKMELGESLAGCGIRSGGTVFLRSSREFLCQLQPTPVEPAAI